MAKVLWEMKSETVQVLPHAKDIQFRHLDEVVLSEYARAGWELVSLAPLNVEGTTRHLVYVFKRPMPKK